MNHARRAVALPSADLIRAALSVTEEGRLVWAAGAPADNPRRGQKAGCWRPDGRRAVSIRREGVLWTIAAERCAWVVHHNEMPRPGEVVDFQDGAQ